MQAHVLALAGLAVHLQELPVGVDLGGQQVGHRQDARPLAEVLADALLLGERIGMRAIPRVMGLAVNGISGPAHRRCRTGQISRT